MQTVGADEDGNPIRGLRDLTVCDLHASPQLSCKRAQAAVRSRPRSCAGSAGHRRHAARPATWMLPILVVLISLLSSSGRSWSASEASQFSTTANGKIVLRAPSYLAPADRLEVAKRLHEVFVAMTAIVGDEPLDLHGGPLLVECHDSEGKSQNDWQKITVWLGHLVDQQSDRRALLPFPVHPVFGHEMAHNFLVFDETACYLELNRAFREAMADVLAYAAMQRLRPQNAGERRRLKDLVRGEIATQSRILRECRTQGLSARSLDWASDSAPPGTRLLKALLFDISERHGWGLWQRLFVSARNSDLPCRLTKEGRSHPLPWVAEADKLRVTEFGSPQGVRALSVFVQLLSEAAGADLSQYFRQWGFVVVPQAPQPAAPEFTRIAVVYHYTFHPHGEVIPTWNIVGSIFNHRGRSHLRLAQCVDPQGRTHYIPLPTDVRSTRPQTRFTWIAPGSSPAGTYVLEVVNQSGLRDQQTLRLSAPVAVTCPITSLSPQQGSTVATTRPQIAWTLARGEPGEGRLHIEDITDPSHVIDVWTVEGPAQGSSSVPFNADGTAAQQSLVPGHRYRLYATVAEEGKEVSDNGCKIKAVLELSRVVEFTVAPRALPGAGVAQ